MQQTEALEYDREGRIQSVTIRSPEISYQYQVEYRYNTKGLLQERLSRHGSQKAFSQRYEYREDGQLLLLQWFDWLPISLGTGDGESEAILLFETAYQYDEKGRLIKAAQSCYDRPGLEVTLEYDEQGRLHKRSKNYPSPTEDPETGFPDWAWETREIETCVYNKSGQLERIKRHRPVPAAEEGGKTSLEDLGETRYQYHDGRLVVKDHVSPEAGKSYSIQYEYDDKDRIRKSVHTQASEQKTTSYFYD